MCGRPDTYVKEVSCHSQNLIPRQFMSFTTQKSTKCNYQTALEYLHIGGHNPVPTSHITHLIRKHNNAKMDSLLTLEPNARQDWKVRVRVSRKWRHIRLNGQTAGVNMIYVDEYVSHFSTLLNLYLTRSRLLIRMVIMFIFYVNAGQAYSCMDELKHHVKA